MLLVSEVVRGSVSGNTTNLLSSPAVEGTLVEASRCGPTPRSRFRLPEPPNGSTNSPTNARSFTSGGPA